VLCLKELALECLAIVQALQVFAGIDRLTLRMLYLKKPAIKSLAIDQASLIFAGMGAYAQNVAPLGACHKEPCHYSGLSNIFTYELTQ
jgi:hypothetical protein